MLGWYLRCNKIIASIYDLIEKSIVYQGQWLHQTRKQF